MVTEGTSEPPRNLEFNRPEYSALACQSTSFGLIFGPQHQFFFGLNSGDILSTRNHDNAACTTRTLTSTEMVKVDIGLLTGGQN